MNVRTETHSRPASRAQIDSWIDVLDHAEPDRNGWRSAFDLLNEELRKARRIRHLVRLPGAVLFLVFGVVWLASRTTFHVSAWYAQHAWLNAGFLLPTLLLFCELIVRWLYPVLQLEGRVAALLRYYGAKDVSPEEEIY
jgi:hypothetical protein